MSEINNDPPVRRSSRATAGMLPVRYDPCDYSRNNHKHDTERLKGESSRSSRSSRKLAEIELEKLRTISKLRNEKELRKLEMQKIEAENNEIERQITLVEAEAALKTASMKSKYSVASVNRDYNNIEEVSAHDKVNSWLEDLPLPVENGKTVNLNTKGSSVHLAESCPTAEVGQKDENQNIGNDDILKHDSSLNLVRDFTTATQAMAGAFQTLAKASVEKMSNNKILGRKLPIFSGNPEDWPMFITLYRSSSEKCKFNDEENMVRLHQALTGKALIAVKSLFVSPKNLITILNILETRFGRPEVIIECMISKARSLPPVKSENPNSLINFATTIQNMTATAASLNLSAYITNPTLLRELLSKLPIQFQYEWAKSMRVKDLAMPTLIDFSEWLEEEAAIASMLYKPSTVNESNYHQQNKYYRDTAVVKRIRQNVFVAKESSNKRYNYKDTLINKINKNNIESCIFCSQGNSHSINKCKKFLDLNVKERWEWAKAQKICFSCLTTSDHRVIDCKEKKKCGILECDKLHHKLLHAPTTQNHNKINLQINEDDTNKSDKSNKATGDSDFSNEMVGEHSLQTKGLGRRVLLRVAPIKIIGENKTVEVYALFDEGSTVSLIDAELAAEVGVQGSAEPLKMFWTNSSCYRDDASMKITLNIKGKLNDTIFTLANVRTVNHLNLPCHSVNVKKCADRWKHLRYIPLTDLENVKPKLLIGQEHIDLTIAREVIQGPANGPIASRTKLGWVIHGNISILKHRVDPEFTYQCYHEDDELKELLRRSILSDSLASHNKTEKRLSPEDKKGLKIMEETSKQIENRHWEIGLLWKSENKWMPESKTAALRRLYSIEKRMDKDPIFEQKYCEQIKSFIEKDYARIVTNEEMKIETERIWYLPHFAVKHPSKPHKFRFVFDARSKSNGVSFNDNLITGPDFGGLKSLVGPRNKWWSNKANISIGDLVIIADSNSPRNIWPMGKISKTYPGTDNKVRVVDIKTVSGEFRRPVHKVILLRSAESN